MIERARTVAQAPDATSAWDPAIVLIVLIAGLDSADSARGAQQRKSEPRQVTASNGKQH